MTTTASTVDIDTTRRTPPAQGGHRGRALPELLNTLTVREVHVALNPATPCSDLTFVTGHELNALRAWDEQHRPLDGPRYDALVLDSDHRAIEHDGGRCGVCEGHVGSDGRHL